MTPLKIRLSRGTFLVLLGLSTLTVPVAAQRLEGTGTVATGLLLRQMDGVKRVLMIAAHPDDEDTSLLTALARGQGAETGYLALTRGDGGQNLIGPELWEGLGIVRTGELLAARRLDGGQQFFTRAFDYGFSKSAEEALTFWPRDELLADVVWVVRSFRPHVIVSVFSGTPADGHGQHQAAGIMAREAFEAAGDPSRFPEQLQQGVEAWAPSKLYQSSRRRFFAAQGAPDDGSLDVQTGVNDPLLGRSLLQLSMESRSQHRSQDMGAAQPPGPSLTGVILVESRVGDDAEELFAGVDTTFAGIASGLPAAAARRATGHLRSGQQERDRRGVIDLLGVEALHEADVVDDRAAQGVVVSEPPLRRVEGDRLRLSPATADEDHPSIGRAGLDDEGEHPLQEGARVEASAGRAPDERQGQELGAVLGESKALSR